MQCTARCLLVRVGSLYRGKGKIIKGNYSGRFFARKNQFGWVLNLRGMMPSVPCWVVIMGGMMPSVRPAGATCA